jgi:hypothetical protein
MLVFLDTEFTNLLRPELLSIGMVTLDGHEFYAELDLKCEAGQRRVKAASDFVRGRDVLGQWGAVPDAACSNLELGSRCARWLFGIAARDRTASVPSVEIAFDYSTDYELLEFALRDAGHWDRAHELVRPANIARLVATIEGELAAESRFDDMRSRGLKRHHALADAHALRASYERVKLVALNRSRTP